jgi:putative PIN family toxin of toxin-antitoxin system
VLRVVLDTSCLVSYVLTGGEIMRRVLAHWRANRFVLLSSPQTRAELAAVLARPQIRRLARTALDPLLEGIERYTWHVPGTLDVSGACRDPKDDKFLAVAVEGEAHYLVSSDRDLLDKRSFQGIVIHNPGQFLLALELFPLDVTAMAQRFDLDTLIEIQESLLLEPSTADRLATAVTLVAGEPADGTTPA